MNASPESLGVAPPAVAPAADALSGYSIVYFGNDWAAENRTSSHHIARRLAKRFPLLYVDSPGLRKPQGTARDVRKAFRKVRQALQPPERQPAGLWRSTVPQLPFRSIPGIQALNRVYARVALHRAMARLGFGRRILWFAVPHPGFLVGSLGEDFVVYYCIDDYAAHPGVDPAAVLAMDDDLSRRADRLFVAPPALLAAKQRLNATATYSPHGVDAELFGRAEDPATVVPAEIAGLPRPIAGFFGSIADWIDVPLLAHLARSRPDCSLALVGHVATDVAELQALPNVHFFGAQPYETLPSWAKAFDVALIPYRQNRQVANANPLKLREYLATGRPVVATPCPEADRFADHLVTAADRDAFVAAVIASVRDDSPARRAARRASVRDQTWDARVEQALSIVAQDVALRRATAGGPAHAHLVPNGSR